MNELQNSYAHNWNKLYSIGGTAALVIVLIIPIQIFIYVVWPPPETAMGFIDLFQQNWVLGLLSLDFLYYINNVLLVLVYLALFVALRQVDYVNVLVATAIGFIGIAAYFASTVGFEMLSLSKHYYSVESTASKQQLIAASNILIATYKGTAFNVYYVLNAFSLILFSATMYKSKTFNKATANWGLIAGILMIVPSTAGTIGLFLSLASLIPWIAFSILIGKQLNLLAKQENNKSL